MALTSSMPRGLLSALTTPLDRDGRVDAAVTRRQVDYIISGGASGLVPIGGAGEYTALSQSDRVAMVRATVEAANRRVPVVAGVLSPGLRDSIEHGREYLAAVFRSVTLGRSRRRRRSPVYRSARFFAHCARRPVPSLCASRSC